MYCVLRIGGSCKLIGVTHIDITKSIYLIKIYSSYVFMFRLLDVRETFL